MAEQFGASCYHRADNIAVHMSGSAYVLCSTESGLPYQTNLGDAGAFIVKYERS